MEEAGNAVRESERERERKGEREQREGGGLVCLFVWFLDVLVNY